MSVCHGWIGRDECYLFMAAVNVAVTAYRQHSVKPSFICIILEILLFSYFLTAQRPFTVLQTPFQHCSTYQRCMVVHWVLGQLVACAPVSISTVNCVERLISEVTTLWRFTNMLIILLLSQTRTVVRECFKGDEASQWKRPIFRPFATPKPFNRSCKKLAGVITSWMALDMQNFVSIGSGVSVPQIRDFAMLLGWLVFSFFWVLQ